MSSKLLKEGIHLENKQSNLSKSSDIPEDGPLSSKHIVKYFRTDEAVIQLVTREVAVMTALCVYKHT
jgi:hypothetical protein